MVDRVEAFGPRYTAQLVTDGDDSQFELMTKDGKSLGIIKKEDVLAKSKEDPEKIENAWKTLVTRVPIMFDKPTTIHHCHWKQLYLIAQPVGIDIPLSMNY